MSELTVIMPVYNGEEFIEEAVNSILNQTFTNFSFIILDDNSTDNTKAILEDFKKKNSRIEIINKSENVGPAILRNEGIKKANTEYIALMDADDISEPDRFEIQLKTLKDNQELGVVGSWFTIFGDKSKIIKHTTNHDNIKVGFLNSCVIGNPTVMFRKTAMNNLIFDEEIPVSEDYALWSKAVHITKFYNIPKSLLRYRWHDKNVSRTKLALHEDAEKLIRVRQLRHFGIAEDNLNLDYYLNVFSLKKRLAPEAIKQTILASKELIEYNKINKNYNQEILEKNINKGVIRTIRNGKGPNWPLFRFITSNSNYIKHMSLIDQLVFTFKCLFSL